MNELTLDGKIYVSSKQAAEMTGYAKDYVGQLCREGRVEARLVGRNWYVLKSAIEQHRFGEKAENKPFIEDKTANPWTPPRYQSDPSPIIPVLKQESTKVDEQEVVENAPEVNFEPSEPIESMQEQWQDWFKTPAVSEEEVIEDEPINIPIHAVSTIELEREVEPVETRYARYTTPDEYVEKTNSASSAAYVTTKVQGGPILTAALLVVILFSFIISYIGAGFAPQKSVNHWPMSIIAGISAYNAQ